jgi:hypothetical protein
MSAKTGSDLDPLDVLLRARTSTLAGDEELAVERALATSAALRIAHQVGHDLDFACRVRARDQALLDRALERALAPRAKPRARRATRGAFVIAATLVVASAAAATHAVVVHRLVPSSSGTAVPAAARAGKPQEAVPVRPRAPGAMNEPSPSPPGVSPPGTENQPARPPAPATQPNPSARTPATAAGMDEPSAGALFREAGQARRAGDVAKARALYLELASRFPTSNEATVSHVSLGSLLLSAGEPRLAERAFGRYLRSGQRSLREEALAGFADALLAMGRTDDERRAREDLLLLDPGGVYASRARRRIAEIDEARRSSAP